jgi:uncharacterized protein YkwD
MSFCLTAAMSNSFVLRSLALLTLGLSLSACSTLPQTQTPQPATSESQPASSAPVLDTDLGLGAQAVASRITLSTGQTQQINIRVGGAPATPGQIAWTTSNASNVSVTQGGLITAVSIGNATVRATLKASPSSFIDFPVTVNTPGAPSPAPAPAPGTSAYAQSVLSLTNAARAVARTCGATAYAAAAPLTLEPRLTSAAQAHAADMAAKNYFSHTSADGRTFDARINATGYTWSNLGENIAAGQQTPEAVVAGWIASPGHCSNIMNGSFTQLGVGYAEGGSYGKYWVQDFGRPR